MYIYIYTYIFIYIYIIYIIYIYNIYIYIYTRNNITNNKINDGEKVNIIYLTFKSFAFVVCKINL